MTALTNFLIATLVSICSTLTGYNLLPQSSDTQISFPSEEITGYNPDDNCISFNEKKCIVLKL